MLLLGPGTSSSSACPHKDVTHGHSWQSSGAGSGGVQQLWILLAFVTRSLPGWEAAGQGNSGCSEPPGRGRMGAGIPVPCTPCPAPRAQSLGRNNGIITPLLPALSCLVHFNYAARRAVTAASTTVSRLLRSSVIFPHLVTPRAVPNQTASPSPACPPLHPRQLLLGARGQEVGSEPAPRSPPP